MPPLHPPSPRRRLRPRRRRYPHPDRGRLPSRLQLRPAAGSRLPCHHPALVQRPPNRRRPPPTRLSPPRPPPSLRQPPPPPTRLPTPRPPRRRSARRRRGVLQPRLGGAIGGERGGGLRHGRLCPIPPIPGRRRSSSPAELHGGQPPGFGDCVATDLTPPAVNQCNGTDNAGGQEVACTVTVINNLDLATGVTSSTLTVTRVPRSGQCAADLHDNHDILHPAHHLGDPV